MLKPIVPRRQPPPVEIGAAVEVIEACPKDPRMSGRIERECRFRPGRGLPAFRWPIRAVEDLLGAEELFISVESRPRMRTPRARRFALGVGRIAPSGASNGISAVRVGSRIRSALSSAAAPCPMLDDDGGVDHPHERCRSGTTLQPTTTVQRPSSADQLSLLRPDAELVTVRFQAGANVHDSSRNHRPDAASFTYSVGGQSGAPVGNFFAASSGAAGHVVLLVAVTVRSRSPSGGRMGREANQLVAGELVS